MPAIWGAAASAFGSFLQYQGQSNTNAANREIAGENRDWQQYMANTAHRREVKDLIAAGLNPMLSVSKGGMGAATPNPPIATMQNPYSHSAEAARQAQLVAAQVRKLDSETELTETENQIRKLDILDPDWQAKGIVPEAKTFQQRLQTGQAQVAFGTANNLIEQWYAAKEARDKVLAEIKETLARAANLDADTINKRVQTILLKYDVPGARNYAKHQEEYEKYNVNVKPFIHDAGELSSAASRARQMFRPDFQPQNRTPFRRTR